MHKKDGVLIGELGDGRIVNVRDPEGSPTLEIRDPKTGKGVDTID